MVALFKRFGFRAGWLCNVSGITSLGSEQCLVAGALGMTLEPCLEAVAAGDGREVMKLDEARVTLE
jgi:hypothetical protein